ncbi:hypothetical protein EYZ11_006574 [Aspergillus tanneri]|uniref:Uncharacterized protein n=1 Tax=Aspergillus tanneri TaxID=1220188 RepID=A0A4S3JF66_9EURO|nr:hypothetical protein EYZ11_006574 [Aspergillus tanneri]
MADSYLLNTWTFTWRNEANDTFTHSSHDVQPCTRIDHAKGREFDFEPDKDAYWFYLWTSDNCTGPPAGKNSPTYRSAAEIYYNYNYINAYGYTFIYAYGYTFIYAYGYTFILRTRKEG